jgi:hypothetical protein
MYPKTLITLAVSGLFLSLLAACGGNGQVRVREGSEQIGSAPTGSVFVTDQASIVHVDEIERLATMRNARKFAANTFLETRDRDGKKTAILKARDNRETGLRTADILEGNPRINDRATPVSLSEMERLQKIYRDPVEE